MKTLFFTALISGMLTLCLTSRLTAQVVVDFEDVGSSLATDSSFRGQDLSGGFSSGGVTFNNQFGTFPGGDFWLDNAYSNQTSWNPLDVFADGSDTVLLQNPDGSANVGIDGSATWGVVTGTTARLAAPTGFGFQTLNLHNTQTAGEIIANGNDFSRPFTATDVFSVTINELEEVVDEFGQTTFVVVDSTDRIDLTVNGMPRQDWFEVDLTSTSVAGASLIGFEFFSTDTGDFGINTPAFVAVDNIELVEVEEVVLGDVNGDGVVNFLDIAPFITILTSGDLKNEADVNQDGAVDFLDIAPFIAVLSNQ